MVIDFISYTENKISQFLVVEFIISLLLKGKEPLFQEVSFVVFREEELSLKSISRCNTNCPFN